MLFDPTLCEDVPSSQNTVLTALLCVGTFLSYLPQHIKILNRRSSDGISPYFILLGTVGAGSNITNIALLQFLAMQCCTVQTVGACLAGLLGIFQVAIQGAMFYITFILYMLFFPDKNKYEHAAAAVADDDSSNGSATGSAVAADASSDEASPLLGSQAGQARITLEWRTALWVAGAIVAHTLICILMSTALVTVIGPYAALTRTWASLLGLFSLCLTCLQFIPQIIKTWRSGSVGAISIPMMMMQTPGGFVFAYSIAIRPGVNWSSWISTFVAATFQGILLIICLLFEARAKDTHGASAGDGTSAAAGQGSESSSSDTVTAPENAAAAGAPAST